MRERNELLLAAGFAPAFPESPLDDEALRPVRQALDTILDGHLPYPAMVVRPHGILVAANRAFDASDLLDVDQAAGSAAHSVPRATVGWLGRFLPPSGWLTHSVPPAVARPRRGSTEA